MNTLTWKFCGAGCGLLTALLAAVNDCQGQAAAAATSPSKMPLPLTVVGTRILNSKNEPVRLCGVNAASLEWTSTGEGHILKTLNVAIQDWHVNIIRLPLCQDRWFGKAPEQKDAGKAYRDLVHQAVDTCATQGCYILLDLHWSDCNEWGVNIGQHSMPDTNSLTFWKDFAPVYANQPAVLFDLYNEPHDISWDVWQKGGTVRDRPNGGGGGAARTYQAVGMQTLLDAVRATGASNVVVAGGLDWAYDMSGFLDGRQLSDPQGRGVIYANHCYDNKNDTVDAWIAKLEKAAAKVPVIVSEFGGASGPSSLLKYPIERRVGARGLHYFLGNHGSCRPGALTGRVFQQAASKRVPADNWLLHVLQAIQDHQWNYTAWDLHTSAGPTLISDWNYTPSPRYGVFLKQMLAGTLPKYTPPQAAPPPARGNFNYEF